MKTFFLKLLLISKICIILLFFTCTETSAQSSRGLLQNLIEIKYSAEMHLSSSLKKEGSQAEKDSALAQYNILRWQVDGLIYQLSSEMIAANSPRKMRLLNEWYLDGDINKNNKAKNKSIGHIIASLENLQVPYAQNRNINLSTNIFYLIKDSYGVVKGLSDLQTQKTMAIIELLDQTRLLSVGEIMKQGK